MDLVELATAAALRARIALEPIGGPGATVYPPTYPNDADSRDHLHVVETYPTPDGPKSRVLMDSVASQANRQEAALAAARRAGSIVFPDIRIDLSGTADPRNELMGTDLPHRLADAIFRDCEIDAVAIAKSDFGRRILEATREDLTPLLEAAPLSLVFGVWFSQWKLLQPLRLQRLSVSEFWAYDATLGKAVSSRLDPLGIERTDIYAAADGGWTVHEGKALVEGGKPKLYGKAKGKGDKTGLPSNLNHGNIAPAIIPDRGITAARYELVWTFSNAALRRLRFGGSAEHTDERDAAAQAYLRALALVARVLSHEEGYALRSRCDLLPNGPFVLELLPSPLIEGDIVRYEMTSAEAIALFEAARDRALSAGFKVAGRPDECPTLVPSQRLADLIAGNRQRTESLADSDGE